MEIALHKTYAVLSILFLAVFPIMWEKGIRPQIFLFLDYCSIVESQRFRNFFLGQLYDRHFMITSILIGIGVIFGILAIF